MKHPLSISALLISALACSNLFAGPADPQRMAWWKLDGNTLDSSGNGYHASSSPLNYHEGRMDFAARIDGSVNPADCGRIPLLRGQMTLAFWIKPSSVQNDWGGYVIKGTDNDNNNSRSIAFRVYNNSYDGQLVYAITAGGVYHDFMSNGRILYNDTWTHIALTYDGHHQKIFVDGMPNAISPDWNAPLTDYADASGPGTLLLGRTANFLPTTSMMDHVQFYNYALTPVQVADLFIDSGGISVCIENPLGDFNDDCRVDLTDIAILSAQWLQCNLYPQCIREWP